jgi:hypothetical protein
MSYFDIFEVFITILCITAIGGAFLYQIWKSLFSIPKNKNEQEFTVETIKNNDDDNFKFFYLLHVKTTYKKFIRVDCYISKQTKTIARFRTKKIAEEKAKQLSLEAQGLLIDKSKSIVDIKNISCCIKH